MSITRLLVSKGIFFKRFAVVTDGDLCDLAIEREGRFSLVGGVYKGRVTKILPAINAAFVNCGLDRPAFLSFDDVIPKLEDQKRRISILDYVTEGSKVLVQVKSDETAGKGARISQKVSLVGRCFVLNPFVEDINVSRRILDRTERQRLARFASEQKERDEGITVRTAAENKSFNALLLDFSELLERWNEIQRLYKSTEKIGLVERAPSGIQRFLTEQVGPEIDSIVVDDRDVFLEVQKYCQRKIPEIVDRIKFHDPAQDIFGDSGVEEQFNQILLSEAPLPSGGRLYFDETRSMTTVDVDTGEGTKGGNRFSRIFQTNLEAATVLGRQLRLRNVGGLIAIDFIGMRHEKDKARVLKTLRKSFENDPCFVRISGFSEFGLVEITRQRQGFSHASLIKDLCMQCKGEGRQQAMMSITEDIFSALVRKISFSPGLDFSVTGDAATISFIRKNCSLPISILEDKWAVSVSFISEPGLGRGEFKVLGIGR